MSDSSLTIYDNDMPATLSVFVSRGESPTRAMRREIRKYDAGEYQRVELVALWERRGDDFFKRREWSRRATSKKGNTP